MSVREPRAPRGELVQQPTAAPTEKAKAGGIVGLIIVAVVAAATALTDAHLPGLAGAAITFIATWGAFYMKRERAR